MNEQFAVRWTGYIKGPSDGEANFYGSHDDGARLKIDGNGCLVIGVIKVPRS